MCRLASQAHKLVDNPSAGSRVPDPLFTGNIAKIISDLVSSGVAASVAMLLSRSGPGTMTAQDRQWARALRLGKHRWPIHLATCDRVQVFAPDDLVAAS